MSALALSISKELECPASIRDDIANWSENFALVGGDEENGIAVFCSIGRLLSDTSIWRLLLFVTLPDGTTAYTRHYGRGDDHDGPCSSLWSLKVKSPGRLLHLFCEGPFWLTTADQMREGVNQAPSILGKLDLEFSSDQPVWDMSGGASESASIAGKLHYEQIGYLNGEISINGHKHTVTNGYANRDHSCGPRDVSNYVHHAWISGMFENGDSFQLYAMQSALSTSYDMSNVVYISEGEIHPAKIVELKISSADSLRRTPTSVIIEAKGREIEIAVCKIVTQNPVSFSNPFDMAPGIMANRNMAVCLDGLIKLEMAGSRGRGWCEIGTATGPLD